jgi:Ethanolamine ammonia lyase large subunit (EutB)
MCNSLKPADPCCDIRSGIIPLECGRNQLLTINSARTAMPYRHTVGGQTWTFRDLKDLMAKASPPRSGDYLAGVAAGSHAERTAARMCLAELPLDSFRRNA